MKDKIEINKIEVNKENQLDDLYNNIAFTLEGFDTSKENIDKLIEWIDQYGGVKNPVSIYITKGSFMNNKYGLTKDNAYPEDLNIVSIKLEDIKNIFRLSVARFEIGARWFSDIVDNNIERQNQINGIEDEEEF